MSIARAAREYFILLLGYTLLGLELFLWGVVSLALIVVLPAPAAGKVGRLGAMWAFRGFLGMMQALGAWRLDIRALDALRDTGPLIVAPNHPCLLDAALIVSRLPNVACVMKRALYGSFLFGPAAYLAGYLRNDSLLRLISSAGQELGRGGQLLLFPEGTRTVGDPIGPFTDAVGAISRQSGVPVQALIIETNAPFLGKGQPVLARPHLPLTYRIRLGSRFDPPADVRAFTLELERYFTHELSTRAVPMALSDPRPRPVEDAQRLRG